MQFWFVLWYPCLWRCGIMLSSCVMSLTRGLLRPNAVRCNLVHTAANQGGALRKTFEPDYLDVSVWHSWEIVYVLFLWTVNYRPTSPISRLRQKRSWMCKCAATTSPCSRATKALSTTSVKTWGLMCKNGNDNKSIFLTSFVKIIITNYFCSWATPSRSFDVKTYQEGGTVVKDTYSINMFERNVQIHSIRSIDLPMLIYLLRYVHECIVHISSTT